METRLLDACTTVEVAVESVIAALPAHMAIIALCLVRELADLHHGIVRGQVLLE